MSGLLCGFPVVINNRSTPINRLHIRGLQFGRTLDLSLRAKNGLLSCLPLPLNGVSP
jgi:hypothetical protein